MKTNSLLILSALCLSALCCVPDAPTPASRPKPKDEQTQEEGQDGRQTYNIYLGNTHAHSQYSGDAVQDNNEPSDHFRLAKAAGYDFYAITDHSQYDLSEEGVAATELSRRWAQILKEADDATTKDFVAFRGYEHSENNGPGAKGHMNVFNSNTYLNALADGIDMKYFQDWLCSVANKNVIVSMNHPSVTQYDTFACYNDNVRSLVTMLELINGPACNDHYAGYLVALSKGWRVSPVAGSDLHGTNKVPTWPARTGIVAKELTRESVYEAMRARRTFATYDATLKMMYYVNDRPMGTVFDTAPSELSFDISITCDNNISKVEILGGDGVVLKSRNFNSKSVSWQETVPVSNYKYFFVNVYGSSATPVAYAAPVWIK